jgi:hypothetical protein
VTRSRASQLRFHLLRFHVLPWVLAALLLRASIPMGPMDTTLAAAMCSSQDMSETLEIPGQAPGVHCDYCPLPPPAPPPALIAAVTFSIAALELPLPAHEAPVTRFALHRAQIPRAPPLA